MTSVFLRKLGCLFLFLKNHSNTCLNFFTKTIMYHRNSSEGSTYLSLMIDWYFILMHGVWLIFKFIDKFIKRNFSEAATGVAL